jgi:hypothetical protein
VNIDYHKLLNICDDPRLDLNRHPGSGDRASGRCPRWAQKPVPLAEQSNWSGKPRQNAVPVAPPPPTPDIDPPRGRTAEKL